MYSGQDGNSVVGTGGTGTIGGAPQGPIVPGNSGFTGGQGMVPNQPMMPGGDIILDNSGDKKSKKGMKWVIGIIVGVLILVGVGVGAMLIVYGGEKERKTVEEETGFSSAKEELVELFRVNEVLREYNVDAVIQSYIDGDFDQFKESIDLNLAELNGAASEYVKNYIDENNNFIDLSERIIEVFDEEGCSGKTVSQLNNCMLSGNQGEIFADRKRELELSRQRAEYTIKMAREWLRDFTEEEAYYNDGE